MCYRTFVALQHSRALRGAPEMHTQWVAALDMLSTFVDALPLEEEEARLGERSRLHCPAAPGAGPFL